MLLNHIHEQMKYCKFHSNMQMLATFMAFAFNWLSHNLSLKVVFCQHILSYAFEICYIFSMFNYWQVAIWLTKINFKVFYHLQSQLAINASTWICMYHTFVFWKKNIGLQGVDFLLVSYPCDKSKESNIHKGYIDFLFLKHLLIVFFKFIM